MSNIAPNQRNPLTSIRLHMCRLTFAPPPRKTDLEDGKKATAEAQPKTVFDAYIDGMKVVPLSQAYVLLVKILDRQSPTEPDLDHLTFCRTTMRGELLRVEEGAIADVPESSEQTQVWSEAEATYEYFWTLNAKRFDAVIEDVRRDYAQAKTLHDFFSFRVAATDPRHRAPTKKNSENAENPFELLGEHPLWGDFVASVFRHCLMPKPGEVPSQVPARLLIDWHIPGSTDLSWLQPYVFARRRLADVVYSAELSQFHALGLLQRSATEYAVFARVENMCENARNRVWVPIQKPPEDDWWGFERHWEFQRYAFRCGCDTRVNRDLFENALPTGVSRSWEQPALEIESITGGQCIHPCKDTRANPPSFHYFKLEAGPYLNIFDNYRFGLTPDVLKLMKFVNGSKRDIHERLKHISGQIRSLLATVPYYEVAVCLGNYPEATSMDEKIHERFLDVSLDVHHKWWDTFDPHDDSMWKKAKPLLDNMGSSLEKIFDIYPEHFRIRENIEKYYAILQTEVDALNMLKKHERWNQRVGGPVQDLKPSNLSVTVKREKSLIRVDAEGEKLIELRFAFRQGGKPWNMWDESYEPHIRVPFPEIKKWPKYLNVFGQVLSTVVSVSDLAEKIREDNDVGETVIAMTRVAKDTFQLVTGFSDVLHKTLPHSKGVVARFAEVGEKIATSGFALEVFLNIYDGAVLLWSEDEGVASAKDVFTFWVQYVKGSALVTSGTFAGYEILAAAWAAAIPAAGVPLALGALVVVACEVALAARRWFGLYSDPVLEALEDAMRKEFPQDFKKERTANSLHRFTETVDLLIRINRVESAWQSTTQSNRANTSH